jgi:hypothetical protein
VVSGYAQQPFMMGIKTHELQWAAEVGAVNPTGFAALRDEAAAWVQSAGYDPVTQGFLYCRVMQACEPVTSTPASPLFDYRTPNISYGLAPSSISMARQLTAEANVAIPVYYAANLTAAAKTWGDTVYGSLWGYPPYTASGYYSSPYQGSNLADVNLASYKWTGFNFGMGMAHQWPAARLGGVQPAAPAMTAVAFNLTNHAGAASAEVTVTAPSGATAQYVCSTSPCSVSLDRRQGAHWVQVAYLNSSGTLLSADPPLLIEPGAATPWSVTLRGVKAGGGFVAP